MYIHTTDLWQWRSVFGEARRVLRLGVVWGILGGTFLEAVVLLLENGTQHNATLSAAHQHPQSWSAAAGVVRNTAFM